MTYKFIDMPHYDKLKYLLQKILLDKYETPKSRLDLFKEEAKYQNENPRSSSTLEINHEWEQMSNESIESDQLNFLNEFTE